MAYDKYSDTDLEITDRHFRGRELTPKKARVSGTNRHPDAFVEPQAATVVHADASHAPTNRLVYGYGIVIAGHGADRDISGIGMMPKLFADNHLAELLAACYGLNMALAMAEPNTSLCLLSDSVNALCVLSGHVSCRLNGKAHVGNAGYGYNKSRFNIQLSPMRTLNPQAVKLLAFAQAAARAKGVAVELQHIPAHTGLRGPSYDRHFICDLLAKKARWHAEKLNHVGRLVSK